MAKSPFYRIVTDVRDLEEGEVPEVHQDIIIPTEAGLKLVCQSVSASGGRSLWDRLLLVASSALLLSDRSYLRTRKLRDCPSIQWYPVQVTWRRSPYPYWVGDTLTEHDIWDYELSEYTQLHENHPRGKGNVGLFRRGVAIHDLMPDFDLFRVRFGNWVGSEALKSTWEEGGLDGIAFIKVEER